ncbi:MAG: extracellular solute-binding protein [Anaerolineae bacterium]|nr:extracellular solute-binding protein [Anaerolineae bacterium]
MSRKLLTLFSLMLIVSFILTACAAPAPAPAAPAAQEPAAAAYDAKWAATPMKEKTTVVLSVESGAQEKTFQSFAPQLLQEMNIDLQVVAHPFSEQYEIQRLDLSSGAGQYDILSYWPMYTADFYKWLVPLKDVQPAGQPGVEQDLEMTDIQDGYQWVYSYKDTQYATHYDGDVKLLNYRHDLFTDPKEKEAFKAKYGYDLDANNLTWEQYLQVGEFFNRPDQDFYGASEIAGFLGGFTLKDRLHGMGGHLFDYEQMKGLGGKGATGESNMDICIKAVQNGIDSFNKIMPPEAKSFEFEDARNQIISEDRVAMMIQWPDVWKWANDSTKASEKANCNVWVAELPGFKAADGKIVHRPEENGGRVLVINKASKQKEAAYKTLVWFSKKERTKELVFNNDTWLDPYRKSHLVKENMGALAKECPDTQQNYIDVINEGTANGYPALQIPGAGRYTEVLERWGKKAWAGQTTAQEACASIAKEFDEITDELGRDAQIKEFQSYVDTVLKPKNLYP